MIEKLRDCFIFFIASDAIFAALFFFARYNFLRPLPKRPAFILYIIMTILLLIVSIYNTFFVDSYDSNCKKLLRNKVLYTIGMGESKTLEEIMGFNVKVYSYYGSDKNTFKEPNDILYFRVNLEQGSYEEIKLNMRKKEIINIDDAIFKAKYKKTSNIAITRDGEKTYSIRLINLENVIYDYAKEDDEVTKSLNATLKSLQKELEPQ